MSVAFEPIQSGTGDPSPTNIRPISGRSSVSVVRTGKNQLPMTVSEIKSANTSGSWSGNVYTLNSVTITVDTDEAGNVTGIKTNGTASGDIFFTLATGFTLSNGSYTLNGCPASGSTGTYTIYYFNNEYSSSVYDTGSGATINGGTACVARILIKSGTNVSGKSFYPMVRASGDSTFAPYMGQTLTIALGQTVYGGTLDVKTGVLTIDRIKVKGNTIAWIDNTVSDGQRFRSNSVISDAKTSQYTRAELICSIMDTNNNAISFTGGDGICVHNDGYIYVRSLTTTTLTDFEAFIADADICYKLATPTTVQLTPAQLMMLKGYNSLSTDGGDVITITAYVKTT